MLTSLEFNEKLHLDNFELLEKEFQNARKYLENSSDELEVSHLKSAYPIYFEYNDLLMVKFPTFKVRIINNEKTENELKDMLKEYGYFTVYDESNVVLMPSFKPVQSTVIHCLGNSLEENKKMAENIISKLKNKHIASEKCVTYGCYPISIKYINKEKTFIKIIKDRK
ncbi:MAG: hypothetical protein ACLRYN_04755 [Clostridium perfringens]